MLFPNALEPTRRLGSAVEQIPAPPDPIFGGGGGVLRENQPGIHLVKLLLIPSGLEERLALPQRAEGEALWSARGDQPDRIAALQSLLDGLDDVQFASRTAKLRTVPRPGGAPDSARAPGSPGDSEGS